MYLVKTKRGIRAIEAKPANFNDLIEQAKNRFADEGFLCEDQIIAEMLISPFPLPYVWNEIKNYTFIKDNCAKGKDALAILEEVKKGPSPLQDLLDDLKKMAAPKYPKGGMNIDFGWVDEYNYIRYGFMNRPKGFIYAVDIETCGVNPLADFKPKGFITVNTVERGFFGDRIVDLKVTPQYKYAIREHKHEREDWIKEMFKMQEHNLLEGGEALIKKMDGSLRKAQTTTYSEDDIRLSKIEKVDTKPLEDQYKEKLRKSHIDFTRWFMDNPKYGRSEVHAAYTEWKVNNY